MGVRAPTAARTLPSIRRSREIFWLIGVYLVAVAIYAALGRVRSVPLFQPDEFIYGHFAQSLASGDGFTWRGEPQSLLSLLYVLLITPAWLIGSSVSGYAIAKVIGALVVCTVAVPVFLLTRHLLAPRLALLAALMSVSGAWMTTSTVILTENLAMPLATAALCATVMALRQPDSRWIFVAVGLAGVAGLARAQLLVLIAVVLLALVVDVARFGSDWRLRAERHKRALVLAGGVTGLLVMLALAAPGLLAGTYYEPVRHFSVSSEIFAHAGRQWVQLVAMSGFAPVVLALSVALNPAAWRDELLGPLLAVTLPAALVLVVETGWFLDGLDIGYGIQRYVGYVVPLLLVVLLAAAVRWELVPRWCYAVVPALALVELAGGGIYPSETIAATAVGRAGEAIGMSLWPSVAAATLAVGLAALWIVRRIGRRAGGREAAWAVGALTLVVLLLQSVHGWVRYVDGARKWQSGFPADRVWLDRAANGPVARLVVTASHPRWPATEFFNRDVTRVYALSTATRRFERGRTCEWTVGEDGSAVFQPDCGAPPRRIYLDDPAARVTFAGQRVVAQERLAGRLVDLPGPPAVPRVESILVMPCDDRSLLGNDGKFISYVSRQCRTVASGYFWLDRKSTLVLGVQGGKGPRKARVGNRTYAIPPREVTAVRVPLPEGASQFEMRFDKLELPLGYPDIVRAELQSRAGSKSIL